MTFKMKAAAAGVLAASMASPTAAQSINPSLDPYQGETHVVAALTIPLGHSLDKRHVAPRAEIIARSRLPASTPEVVARDDERRWQERRVGFTLGGQTALLINGQPVHKDNHRDGVSTLGAIGIGVGVVLVGSIILFAIEADDIGELTFPEG
jgi:hypothetical protein